MGENKLDQINEIIQEFTEKDETNQSQNNIVGMTDEKYIEDPFMVLENKVEEELAVNTVQQGNRFCGVETESSSFKNDEELNEMTSNKALISTEEIENANNFDGNDESLDLDEKEDTPHKDDLEHDLLNNEEACTE